MKKLLYLFLVLPLIFSSCKKEEGCTDSQATNYIADAEEDDGSCLYSIVGLWNLDDRIIDTTINNVSVYNNVSQFYDVSPIYLDSGIFHLYENNTYLYWEQWNDGDNNVATGLWNIIGNSVLNADPPIMPNMEFEIIELTASKLKLSQLWVAFDITYVFNSGILIDSIVDKREVTIRQEFSR